MESRGVAMLDHSSAVDEHDSTKKPTRIFTGVECSAPTITPWKETEYTYLPIYKQTDDKADEGHPLCFFCEKIFLNTIWQHEVPLNASSFQFSGLYVETKHHFTLSKLKASGDWGCQLCLLLFKVCAMKYQSSYEDLLKSSYTLRYLDYSNSWTIRGLLALDLAALGCQYTFSILSVTTGSILGVYPNLVHSSMLEISAGSEISFDLVKDWLRKCQNSHERCSKNYGFTPTRLIHVSEQDGCLKLRLVLPTKLSGAITYFTLSHCWGSGRHLKLHRENIVPFFTNIPTSALSKSFIDAVQITLRLQCSYLWIDSLCIQQDDDEDWLREAAIMGEVYQNGTLNIAAASAADGSGGCFARMNDLSHRLSKLQKNANDPGFAFPSHLPHSQYRQSEHIMLQRAWVIPERALAPRTLFYTSDMMYWECLDSSASEMNWRFSPNRTTSEDTPYSVKLSLAYLLALNPTKETSDWHYLWWQIVSTYTACKLTFVKDRWIALSGIAKVIQSHTSWPLVAGMWKTHLLRELCWTANKPSKRLSAPTWSWISIDASVRNEWMAPRSRLVADVIRAPESYQDHLYSNQHQHIDNLEINGPLLRFMCGPRHESKEEFNRVKYSMNLAHWPSWLGGSVSAEWYPDIEFDEKAELWALQVIHDNFDTGNLGYRGTSVRRFVPGDGPRSSRYWKYEGLVVSSEDCATWTRLGYFKISVATDRYYYRYEHLREQLLLPILSTSRKIELA